MFLRALLSVCLILFSSISFAQSGSIREYRDFAMSHEGNVARGKVLFNDETRAACVKCHTVDGSAAKAGPDLMAVGEKFPRRDLIQAILEPSSAIAVGYGSTTIETRDGEEITGIVKESSDAFVDLITAEGKHVRLTSKDNLYLGMGDTGPQQDPQGHGQDLSTLLGKMVRIDVDHTGPELPYAIPADNPFINTPGARPEIFALGFREPWRFSFDTLNGDLWVADVGQDRVEEVDIVRKGENLGWNVYEGFEPFSNKYRKEGAAYIQPVFAYRRKFGNSVTGGFVYRGDKNSTFYGAYICGDYTSRRIFAIKQENRVLKSIHQIATAPQSIASFGTDESGNIYVVGYEGMVYNLDFTTARLENDTAVSAIQ